MLASYIRKWLEINGVPKKVKDIVGYCIRKENGKVFDDWDKDVITTMVAYHLAKDTISVVYEGDEVVGVHMWYNCNYDDGWDFVMDWEEDDLDGDTIFIAFLFASDTEALKKMTLKLIEKEPDVLTKKLVTLRYRNGEPTKVDMTTKYFSKILKR